MSFEMFVVMGSLAIGFGSLIASFWILAHGKKDLEREREQYFKILEQTRTHYESALDSMQRKFMARGLPDFAYSEGARTSPVTIRTPQPPVEGPNGEVFESQEQEDAIAYASRFGLPYEEALRKIKQGQQSPAGPVGNDDMDAM